MGEQIIICFSLILNLLILFYYNLRNMDAEVFVSKLLHFVPFWLLVGFMVRLDRVTVLICAVGTFPM